MQRVILQEGKQFSGQAIRGSSNIPFFHTVNALAHLDSRAVHKQLASAFNRLSHAQNAAGHGGDPTGSGRSFQRYTRSKTMATCKRDASVRPRHEAIDQVRIFRSYEEKLVLTPQFISRYKILYVNQVCAFTNRLKNHAGDRKEGGQ